MTSNRHLKDFKTFQLPDSRGHYLQCLYKFLAEGPETRGLSYYVVLLQ